MGEVRNYSAVSPLLVVAVMVFIFWTLTNIGLYYDCSPLAPALEVARLLASAAGVLALGIYLYILYLDILFCVSILFIQARRRSSPSLSRPRRRAGWRPRWCWCWCWGRAAGRRWSESMMMVPVIF